MTLGWIAVAVSLVVSDAPHPCDVLLQLDDRYADGEEDADELRVCLRIVEVTEAAGLSVPLALALVHHESRFHEDDVTGVIRGPWQVHTGYYCGGVPADECDLYAAGTVALASALSDCDGDHECAVCEWLVGGACETEHEFAWARSVLALSRRIGR